MTIRHSISLAILIGVGGCGVESSGMIAEDTADTEAAIAAVDAQRTVTVLPDGTQRVRFQEPHWPIWDVLACTPLPCQISMGADSSWSVDIFKFQRFPDAPSHIATVSDDNAVDVSRVQCVGACDTVVAYNWEELTNNAGNDLKMWPNPSHPDWTCRNDSQCLRRGNPWTEDCWTHANMNYRPSRFPTYITHHSHVTYNLDFTCRVAQRDCQYRLDADWSVHFVGCFPLDGRKSFGSNCEANWGRCH